MDGTDLNAASNKMRFVGESRWPRLLVIAGFALAISYTLAVLGQIGTVSTLGVHCLFSTRLLSLDPTYLSPENQKLPPNGCQIIGLGQQKVGTWPTLLRLLAMTKTVWWSLNWNPRMGTTKKSIWQPKKRLWLP